MNKGIIMEVSKNYAIALNDEGAMDKIKLKGDLNVGQKIFYFEEDILSNTRNNIFRYNSFMKALGTIAALFLIVFTFFHTMKPQEAYAVVSLDINPSIQIEADSKLNIIKVEGINDDAKNIDFSDIKDVSLESGIQKIKNKLEEKNYLVNNKEVLVGYAFENNDASVNEKSIEDIKGAINTTFTKQEVVYVKGNKESVDEAKAKGISIGRYEAALKVEDEKIKDNISKAPVKDIAASIKGKVDVKPVEQEEDKTVNTQTSSQTTTATPSTNSNESSEVNNGKSEERPNVSGATDKTESNTESGNAAKELIKPEKNKDVLEVEPDEPAQSSSSSSTITTPNKDSGTNVAPSTGTGENNTNGKSKDDDGKAVTLDPSKTTDISGDKKTKN